MALTIPQAGTIAGRAAQITVGKPETGTALAEFGDRMLQHGLKWKADQRQMQVQQAQLDFTRDMGAARLEVDQIADPAQIGPAWDQRYAEIQSKYITDDTDPEVAAALKMSMQGLGDKHALALSDKTIALGKSRQEAAWIETQAAITTEAATADPTTFGALVEMGEAAIDDRVAKGLIDPAKGAEEKISFSESVYKTRAKSALEADPAAFQMALKAGDYDLMGGDAVVTYGVAAQQELDRRAAAVAKDAETAQAAKEKEIDQRLDANISLNGKGLTAVDAGYLMDPEVMARPRWPEAMAANQLLAELPNLQLMTEAELTAQIDAEKARTDFKEPWEAKRLDVLTARRDEVRSKAAADPVAFDQASGLTVPPLPEFDPADPQAFAAALPGRLAYDEQSRKTGRSKGPAIFTNEQKTALKATIDPKADPAPKVALAEAILAGSSNQPGTVLAALEADPVFRRGVKVLSLTGDRALVESMLRGAQKVELKQSVVPSRAQQNLAFDALTGGTFKDAPAAVREELMGAALGVYADLADGIDGETTGSDGWIADGAAYTLYQQSLQRVMGAQIDPEGAMTIGGLQEVNGGLTVLPPGVAVQEVENGMFALTNQLNGALPDNLAVDGAAPYAVDPAIARARANPDGPDAATRMRAFTSASLFGGSPDFGAEPADFFSGLTLRRLGETDVYEFTYERNGRIYTVPQTDGRAYRFRLTDLLAEAGR